jgi:hypothetical protein
MTKYLEDASIHLSMKGYIGPFKYQSFPEFTTHYHFIWPEHKEKYFNCRPSSMEKSFLAQYIYDDTNNVWVKARYRVEDFIITEAMRILYGKN